ncbi:hypothetical protein, partial [Streptomyces sp. G-5]|uniref:hypothetical protein n=1 Tax=Streptomyces sp. G-5 TaxID=2977231 RepID=UPI0021D14549
TEATEPYVASSKKTGSAGRQPSRVGPMNLEFFDSVAGYLFTSGVSRAANAVGATVGRIVDKTLEAALAHLEKVVRDQLGTDEALEDLDEETTAAATTPDTVRSTDGGEPPTLSQHTREDLIHSLKRAVRKDPDFADRLTEVLTIVQEADPGRTAAGGVTSSGGGTTAGRDVHITASGTGAVAVGGNADDINLTAPGTAPATNGASASGHTQDPHTPGPHQS